MSQYRTCRTAVCVVCLTAQIVCLELFVLNNMTGLFTFVTCLSVQCVCLDLRVCLKNMYVYSCVFNSATCLFIMGMFFPSQHICLWFMCI